MKLTTRTIYAAGALLTIGLSPAVFADGRDYSDGPVINVASIRTVDGHFDDYLHWLATGFKKQQEAAKKAGRFKQEIVPVSIKTRKGEVIFAEDEYIKDGVTYEAIAKLKPAFRDPIARIGWERLVETVGEHDTLQTKESRTADDRAQIMRVADAV